MFNYIFNLIIENVVSTGWILIYLQNLNEYPGYIKELFFIITELSIVTWIFIIIISSGIETNLIVLSR